MRVLHLFAGAGGSHLAGELLGWKSAGSVELNPHARAVIRRHYPNERMHDDINTFNARSKVKSKGLQPVSRAKGSHVPERGEACRIRVQPSGGNSGDASLKRSLPGLSSKTPRSCKLKDFKLFWKKLPKSGTMRNGVLFAQPMLERPISDAGCSYSYIPTPTTRDLIQVRGLGKATGNKRGTTLGGWVRMFPTPTCQDAHNNGGPSQHRRKVTPLNAVIGGKLNPTWVEWLMGWPVGWTELSDSEMAGVRSKRRQRSCSSGRG